MDTAVNPIYLVGGGKGGVGKSLVALRLSIICSGAASTPCWWRTTRRTQT